MITGFCSRLYVIILRRCRNLHVILIEIEQRVQLRLALLPIGAYEPRWFMSPIHMGPDEAVRAHEILAARTSIAIHHGTFQLGDEGVDTPERQISACAPGDSFLVLSNGQSVTLI